MKALNIVALIACVGLISLGILGPEPTRFGYCLGWFFVAIGFFADILKQ